MLCTDLTLPVTIVLSVMGLTLGFPAENIHENCLLVFVEIRDSQLPKEYPSCPVCRSTNTWHKNKSRRYLEPIIIKLKNVFGKCEEKEKEIQKYYSQFSRLTFPKNKKLRNFGCLNFKQLKRKVAKLTKEMRKIYKDLQYLIYLEEQLNLKQREGDENELKMLKEFRAEIKNLIVELKHCKKKKNKTRNESLTRQVQKKAASANLSRIKSQTKLHLEEVKLLRNLNTTSKQWLTNLKNFSECL